MFNDHGYVNESQVYEQGSKTYKNETDDIAGREFEPATQHSYIERLTKQDAIRLESDIRKWVPATLKSRTLNGKIPRLTLEEVCAVFRCKYNFARSRLKAMVQEGILLSEGGQGSLKEQFYLPPFESSMNTEDFEGTSNNTQESEEDTKSACVDRDVSQDEDIQSNNKDKNLSLVIDEINKKISKIQEKILQGQQKIQHLEISKRLLLEEDLD